MTTVLSILMMMYLVLATGKDGTQEKEMVKIKGPYLGQKPPGMTPEIFAPGIVSTGLHDDHGPVFSKDGTEMYGRIAGKPFSIVYVIKSIDGGWLKPETAPFSGKYEIVDFAFSSDGKRLYFSSDAPLDGEGEPKDTDIWYVDRVDGGWSQPVNIGKPLDTDNDDYIGSVTSDNTLYYTVRKAESGRLTLFENYSCRFENDRLTEPRKLDYPFNSQFLQTAPVFSPDETYAVMAIRGREDSFGQEDLYVTFKKRDGSWTEPQNLGRGVNSNRTDWFPSFSPDGKYLFFVSWRYSGENYSQTRRTYEEMIKLYQSPIYGWGADIYWVSTARIRELRPNE